jgi:hypothetical protein
LIEKYHESAKCGQRYDRKEIGDATYLTRVRDIAIGRECVAHHLLVGVRSRRRHAQVAVSVCETNTGDKFREIRVSSIAYRRAKFGYPPLGFVVSRGPEVQRRIGILWKGDCQAK